MKSAKDLRIVYMGTPDFAVAPLRALVEGGYNVVAVVTTPDKPSGRGLKVNESAVKRYAVEAGLPILQPVKLRDEEFVEAFRALDADLGIVIAFRMLPEIIWSAPKMGTFNLHASLLPQYRGAAPINRAIMNGETVTGVTTFLLNPQIDEGAIIGQVKVDIEPADNVGTLHDKLMNVGTDLVLETVAKLAAGEAQPIEQSEVECGELKPAPKIFKEDCHIDFGRSGEEIINQVRGLSPYPAAWASLTDTLTVKIFDASFEPSDNVRSAGEVVSDDKRYIKVACADGYISIKELQLSGKKRMSAEELLRGFRNICSYMFN
ncbi:MAG: methionyl-tRNA formyltransferase [Rikenellaceae bacterium]|nr:methionyl-tRNA formyltransferase [Rikenellaceae bacterium]